MSTYKKRMFPLTLLLVLAVRAEDECRLGFSQYDHGKGQAFSEDDRQFLVPTLNFTCSGAITRWSIPLEATGRRGSIEASRIDLQIWSLTEDGCYQKKDEVTFVDWRIRGTIKNQHFEGEEFTLNYSPGDFIGFHVHSDGLTPLLAAFSSNMTVYILNEKENLYCFNPLNVTADLTIKTDHRSPMISLQTISVSGTTPGQQNRTEQIENGISDEVLIAVVASSTVLVLILVVAVTVIASTLIKMKAKRRSEEDHYQQPPVAINYVARPSQEQRRQMESLSTLMVNNQVDLSDTLAARRHTEVDQVNMQMALEESNTTRFGNQSSSTGSCEHLYESLKRKSRNLYQGLSRGVRPQVREVGQYLEADLLRLQSQRASSNSSYVIP